MNANEENIYIQKDKEIRIMDLLFFVLKKWRIILLFILLFSVLLGFGIYMRDKRNFRTELTNDEKIEVLKIEDVIKELDLKKEYYENSILMKVNPYAENIFRLEYYVNTDYTINYAGETEADYTSDLIKGYENYINGGGLGKGLIEKLDLNTDSLYVNELIDFEQDAHVFSIEISFLNEEMGSKIENTIKESIEEYQMSLSDIMGEHKLILVNSSYNTRINEDLLLKQNSTKESIEATELKLNGLKNEMNTLELNYYNDLLDDGEENSSVEYGKTAGVSFQIKYFVLGGLLGASAMISILVIFYLFNGKLKFVEELKDYYGVKVLGMLSSDYTSKIFFIDRWIIKLQHRNKEHLSYQKQIELLISNIYLACKRENFSHVILTGKNIDIDSDVILDIISKLKKRNIQLSYSDDLVYNVTALESAVESDCVILVEQINKSMYKNVEQEIQLCADQKIKIMGCIVLN